MTRASRFEGFGGIWATTAALTDHDDPEQLRVGLVTPDFFSVLGANAALGTNLPRERRHFVAHRRRFC